MSESAASSPVSSWMRLGLESAEAARLLHRRQLYRSSTSRAYYSMYSLMIALLKKKRVSVVRRNFENPGHEQLQALIRTRLVAENQSNRELKRVCRRLLVARRTADYQPRIAHGEQESLRVVRDLARVTAIVEKEGAA